MKITDKVPDAELHALFNVAVAEVDAGLGDRVMRDDETMDALGLTYAQLASILSELKSARTAIGMFMKAEAAEQENDALQERRDLEADITHALEEHCASFCLDNEPERTMTAHFVTDRLIVQGWKR